MAMAQAVRWGLIGCGDIAEKRVVAAIQSAKNAELLACARRISANLKDFQERHRMPKGYVRASELLQDPEIDAVPGNTRITSCSTRSPGRRAG